MTMHMGHSHAHHDHAHEDDDHDHDHTHAHEVEPSLRRTAANLPFSLWGQLLNPQSTLLQKRSGKVLLAALIVVIPAFVRKSFTRLDVAAFGVISAVLLVFDGLRFATKKWISKVCAGAGLCHECVRFARSSCKKKKVLRGDTMRARPPLLAPARAHPPPSLQPPAAPSGCGGWTRLARATTRPRTTCS